MKIAILQDDFPPESFGGAAVVTHNLAMALKARGSDVFVITATEKNDFIEEWGGVKIYRLKSKPHGFFKHYLCLYDPRVANKVKKILAREKPDVAHCHNLQNALSYYCLRLAREFSKKVFLTAHDAMLFTYGKLSTEQYAKSFDYKISIRDQITQAGKQYNPFRNFIIRRLLKNVNQIFAVSSALKSALIANGLKNIEAVHNSVKVEDFETSAEETIEFKKRYNLENKKIIFFGGRVSKPKGAEKILETMKIVAGKTENAVLTIAGGEKGYLDHLKELSRQFGLEKKILFLGQIPHDEMKIIYGASDVVVVPSLYLDPFPTVNLEAMACKKPVVGTCFGGTPEIVLDGQTGYIVNPFNIKIMTQRIIDLLKNKELAQKMGEEGYQRVKENFSLDKHIQIILKWYQS